MSLYTVYCQGDANCLPYCIHGSNSVRPTNVILSGVCVCVCVLSLFNNLSINEDF